MDLATITSSAPRTALVTGGTGGIGAAVALALAAAGDRVVIVGRNRERGEAMLARMHARSPLDHRFIAADLSLMAEARRAVDILHDTTPRLDAAVFCAGILSTVPNWTAEGFERTLALNYLSRYLMARRLLPALGASPSGRLVLVASAGMYRDTLDFGDLQLRRGRRGLAVAGRTQFANDLFAIELSERLGAAGPAVTCVFPGFVRTGVFDNAIGLPFAFRFVRPLIEARSISPEAAADTPTFLAHAAEAAALGGRFFGPHGTERRIPRRARRPDRRAGLWDLSDELVRRWL